MGKDGLSDYESRGYIPDEVSRSLDFGFADYATAQVTLISKSQPQLADHTMSL
jgi:putative alpha-1,2-mannosidase